MTFQVSNTSVGYVVEAHIPDAQMSFHWEPLRNFGTRQGDARDYAYVDCPQLSDREIRQTASAYDAGRTYIRRRFRCYQIAKEGAL